MGQRTFMDLWRAQRAPVPPVLKVGLSGKTVLVVGANMGLGFESALHLARMDPAKLVLGCRSRQKGEEAVAKIKELAAFDRVELGLVDLSRFDSVSQFTETFKAGNSRLDLLICNAGVASMVYETAPTGWENQIQVNHLGTALVSLLLLPLLEKTGREFNTEPRLVIVSSDRHFHATVADDVIAMPKILETLSSKDYCTRSGVMGNRYPLSKLLNVLFTRALAARLAPTSPVIVTTVNPGWCHSGLDRNAPLLFWIIAHTMKMIMGRTTEEGAREILWAALAGDTNEGNKEMRERLKGAYVSEYGVQEVSDWVLTKEGHESERRIWEETLATLEGVEPKVRNVASELFVRQA